MAWRKNELARFYHEGVGGNIDEKEAFRWYKAAAEKGLKDAQYNVGLFYRKGTVVPKDDAAATKMFAAAAEGNNNEPGAEYELGLSYLNGLGVPKDEARAVELFEKAAFQGYKSAQFELGLCYRDGKGVPKDIAKAYAWLKLASAGGGAVEIIKARDKVLEGLTPEQLQQGQKLVEELTGKLMSKSFNTPDKK